MLSDISHPNSTQISREIPKEVLFRISSDTIVATSANIPDIRKDTRDKNKWWIKLPEEWSNRKFKDKVLGIRNIYQIKDWFDIQFEFYICFKTEEAYVRGVYYRCHIKNFFIGRDTTLREICDYFNRVIQDFLNYSGITIDTEKLQAWGYFRDHYPINNYCRYAYVPDDVDKNKRRCIISWNQITGTMTKGDIISQHGSTEYAFIDPTEDAELFFGKDIFQYTPKNAIVPTPNISTQTWDRKEIYITSSLAQSSDKNAYFGQTNTIYTPIKYFRLDSDDKEFWIQLYWTAEHRHEVNDITRWADLYIEAIFMYSTAAMI
jgi:hypothetical protein